MKPTVAGTQAILTTGRARCHWSNLIEMWTDFSHDHSFLTRLEAGTARRFKIEVSSNSNSLLETAGD
ncbi:MAG TPA: hypothetical protein VK208_11055, partial [Pyrinomonadaceae bacterium]|nr:hypothetical protein [Pyrinomonadaceae bacterium]